MLVSLIVIVVFWLIVSTTFGFVRSLFHPSPRLEGEQLSIEINQPIIQIPDPNSKPQSPDGPLTTTTAEEIIGSWLSTKAAALGPNHEVDNLQQILTGSSLLQWRSIALQDKSENRYRKYEHSHKVESVEKIDNDSDRTAVEATVKEITQFYQHGQLKKASDETLRVKYNLVRQEGIWRIQSMSVINKITLNF